MELGQVLALLFVTGLVVAYVTRPREVTVDYRLETALILINELGGFVDEHHYQTDRSSGLEKYVCVGCGRNPCVPLATPPCSVQILLTATKSMLTNNGKAVEF